MKAGKIWGQTELIHANGVLEFHRIEFKKNVYILSSLILGLGVLGIYLSL